MKLVYINNNRTVHTDYIIQLLSIGGHGMSLNSTRHIDRRGVEVNMIKFTVQ